jgi:hypothetical protein
LLQCGQNKVDSLWATEQDQHATGTAVSITFNMSQPYLNHPLLRERRTAAAGARRVRIDKVEALPHQRLLIVKCHAMQIKKRLWVNEHAHAIKIIDAVSLARACIELNGVGKARAAAAHHAQPQATFFRRDALSGHGGANTLDGALSHLQPLGRRARRRVCRRRSCKSSLSGLRSNCHHIRHVHPISNLPGGGTAQMTKCCPREPNLLRRVNCCGSSLGNAILLLPIADRGADRVLCQYRAMNLYRRQR